MNSRIRRLTSHVRKRIRYRVAASVDHFSRKRVYQEFGNEDASSSVRELSIRLYSAWSTLEYVDFSRDYGHGSGC